jgi:hypothetical protein
MKKILLILTVLFFSKSTQAQRNIKGYVVTNVNDTIKCRFLLDMNTYNISSYSGVISSYSGVIEKSIIIKESGEEVKYLPTELKIILINTPFSGEYKYVSLKQNKNHFFHERVLGKLSFYTVYNAGIPVEHNYQTNYIIKNGKLFKISRRKKMGKLIIDYPELYNKWMNSENYRLNQIEEVVNLYNEHFKK